MNNFDYEPFYRHNLPRMQLPGATFFVTFNLVGTLPRRVLLQWRSEKKKLETEKLHILKSQNGDRLAAVEKMIFQQKRDWFRTFEKILHRARYGPVWLEDERIAKEVADSIHYLDKKIYRLDAYCIMANHVHVVFAPLPIQPSTVPRPFDLPANHNTPQAKSLCYNTLPTIMQSLKGYTAKKANQLLGRKGIFWHREDYDHCVQNPNEWQRIMTYVLDNPIKAGLVDEWQKWQWSYYRAANWTRFKYLNR